MDIQEDNVTQAQELPVEQLYEYLREKMELTILVGKGNLQRKIKSAEINRPGLAFSGYFGIFSFDRVQLVGNTESGFICSLDSETRCKHVANILSYEVPCFLVTNNNTIPQDFLDACDAAHVPVMLTPDTSTRTASLLIPYLEEHFALTSTTHGELLSVYGMGALIVGKSGVGKSECALDLVERGHRLLADDVVIISSPRPNELYGCGNEILGYNMEIRGIGIFDVQSFFGVASVGERSQIDLVIQLEAWHENKIYDRTGFIEKTRSILGVDVPLYELPVKPGRNVPMLIEMACLAQRMKNKGIHPASLIQEKLAKKMR